MDIRTLRFAITRTMDRTAGVTGVIVHDQVDKNLSLDVITVDPTKPNPSRKDEQRYRITIEPIP